MNPLRAIWQRGEPALGGWLSVPSPVTAEIMARIGFDWLVIDLQHGLIDYRDALAMLQAISNTATVPIARVPWNEPGIIGKVLDAGALGVIVPMIETVEDVERAVRACRYPPRGRRSYGPTRAPWVHGGNYFNDADALTICLPMVETRSALEHLDEILEVPGIDGVFVGPRDLSLALELDVLAREEPPELLAAFAQIVAACRRQGLVAGCAASPASAPARLREGFLFVEVGRDTSALQESASRSLREARRGLASDGPKRLSS